ncbi:MAG: hypothetical protein AAFX53_09470, partial [Bacteroidota bacterium]
MELVLNRIHYRCVFDDVKIIISQESDALTFSMQWQYFIDKFGEKNELEAWAKRNEVDLESRISYEFSHGENTRFFSLPLTKKFHWRYTFFKIGQGLINQGLFVDFQP